MKSKLTIVGGVPTPIGGVTTFILRLILKWPSKIRIVFDLYPSNDKVFVPVPHVILGSFGLLKLFVKFLFSVSGPVYFNFSGVRGLIFLASLPKVGKTTWAITLHNGNLTRKSWVENMFMRRGLEKCEHVGVLSPKQERFFLSLGARKSTLQKISSFIPRNPDEIPDIDVSELPEFFSWQEQEAKIFIVSGYPTKIYQHTEVFETFERLWNKGLTDVRLAAFLYGEDSDDLLNDLKCKFADSPFACLYWGKKELVFLSALKECSGYIRMNMVDSFGVAVAEAISFGKPVLASNVCERFSGARLVDPSDTDSVERFVIDVCSNQFERIPVQKCQKSVETFITTILDN